MAARVVAVNLLQLTGRMLTTVLGYADLPPVIIGYRISVLIISSHRQFNSTQVP
jgi:hypothetical protein